MIQRDLSTYIGPLFYVFTTLDAYITRILWGMVAHW